MEQYIREVLQQAPPPLYIPRLSWTLFHQEHKDACFSVSTMKAE